MLGSDKNGRGRMLDGARCFIRNWMRVRKGEEVLIVSDEQHVEEALILSEAALSSGGRALVALMSSVLEEKADFPAALLSALEHADCVIAATHYSIATTPARNFVLEKKRGRFLSLPMSSQDGTSILASDFIYADLDDVKRMADAVAARLTEGCTVHAMTELGTDVTFAIDGRQGRSLYGLCEAPGSFASVSLEANIAPLETKTEGIIYLDGTMGYDGPVTEPVRMVFKEGRAVEIEASAEGRRLSGVLEKVGDPKMFIPGELGIGLNPKAFCLGRSYLEDESAYGTFHLGMGRNTTMGGVNAAKGHIDIVIKSPDIYVDDVMIMRRGELII